MVARTLPEALAKVRERLGPDAMILSTQMLRPAPWRFWERPGVEVYAADDWPAPRTVPRRSERPETTLRTDEAVRSEPVAGSERLPAGTAALPAAGSGTGAHTADAAAGLEAQGLHDLARAVAELRREVETLRSGQAQAWLAGLDPVISDATLREALQALTERGVPSWLAQELAERVRAYLQDPARAVAYEDPRDAGVGVQGTVAPEAVRAASPRTLADVAFAALTAWLEERTDPAPQRPRVVALVGPTGAGKTTTLAKLTARAVLERGERAAVVTADTYRIAAVDQLRTYADILGVPIRIAITPDDLGEAVKGFSDMDRVFIDTPGRNMRNPLAVAELGNLVRRAEPDAVDLVVPAVLAPEEAEDLARTFAASGLVTRMVISKWDEAARPGAMLGALSVLDRPLVCVTTGQTVPDDLAYPTALELTRAIREGGLPG